MCQAHCSALILANSVRDSNVDWYNKLEEVDDWSGVLTWMQWKGGNGMQHLVAQCHHTSNIKI